VVDIDDDVDVDVDDDVEVDVEVEVSDVLVDKLVLDVVEVVTGAATLVAVFGTAVHLFPPMEVIENPACRVEPVDMMKAQRLQACGIKKRN
jgi:hypothetical protein